MRTAHPGRSPKTTTAAKGTPGTSPQGKEDLCPTRTLQEEDQSRYNSNSPQEGIQAAHVKEGRRRKPTAVSSGCPVTPWQKKSKESICTGTPDLGRSYFPELKHLVLLGFRAIRAIICIILNHAASAHPSMFFLLLYCTAHTQYCSIFPSPQVCPGCQYLRAEQEMVTAQFQIALSSSSNSLSPHSQRHLHYLAILPMCPSFPFPPELPPHVTY